jgi:hypothetical protein
VNFEQLNINVTGDGTTAIDPQGAPMSVATSWKDLDGYEDWMTRLLLRGATTK